MLAVGAPSLTRDHLHQPGHQAVPTVAMTTSHFWHHLWNTTVCWDEVPSLPSWLQTAGFHGHRAKSLRITKNWFKACRSSSDIVTALSPKVSCRWKSVKDTSKKQMTSGQVTMSNIYHLYNIYIDISGTSNEISHWHTFSANRCAISTTSRHAWNSLLEATPPLAWPSSHGAVWRPGWKAEMGIDGMSKSRGNAGLGFPRPLRSRSFGISILYNNNTCMSIKVLKK